MLHIQNIWVLNVIQSLLYASLKISQELVDYNHLKLLAPSDV